MSNAFVGEIRGFANSFCPAGWLPCDGSLLPVSQYQMLFAVIGTTYGGNGTSTFALPNLQGTAMLGAGQSPGLSAYPIGLQVGTQTVTLTDAQMPQHNHTVTAINAAGSGSTYGAPQAQVSHLSRASSATALANAYSDQPANVILAPETLTKAGNDGAHENRQPFAVLIYGICNEGAFPTPG